MTVKEVFELRKQGRVEEAYDAIRTLYATDKGAYTSTAMFWTATDILRKRVAEGRIDEAQKILLALERMLPRVPDKEGWVADTYKKCQKLICHHISDFEHEEAHHLQLGKWGEDYAAAYLREKGYVILERDWHSGHRDIDIIARKDNCLVFVEVKTRTNNVFSAPELAVDYKKQYNLQLAINHYIKSHRVNIPIRFDVITVIGNGITLPEINHIEDFQLNVPIIRR